MINRNYTDELLKFIDSEVAELREGNNPLTRAFFDNPVLETKARSAIDIISGLYRWMKLTDDAFKQCYQTAVSEYRANNATDITASMSLQKTWKESWLNEARIISTNWHYSDRYFRYLKDDGRPDKIVAETQRSSLEILTKIGDPKEDKSFFVKGLVMGSVQSGKTANFNAVINGAIDLDYTLIIVLSGIMEDLRVQTQLRIENDVIGWGVTDLEKGTVDFKGVGNILKFGELGDNSIRQVIIPTSPKADFNKNIKAAEFTLNYKNVLVCKKNSSVLTNLLLWLSDYLNENNDKHGIPFLLVDDEADNASLNNMGHQGREYATKINGHIRALLGLFKRKTYIGYTATPFANVLQDRNEAPDGKWQVKTKINGLPVVKEFAMVPNLAPDDFIELLFPPSVYVGAKHFFETRIEEVKKIEPLVAPPVTDHLDAFPSRVFKETGLPSYNYEPDSRASKKDDLYPQYLPNSLKEAIMCFIISTAIRLSRRSEMIDSKLFQPHNTMLIHISRFTNWQNTTKELVKKYAEELFTRLDTDLPSSAGSIYSEFERIWFKYYAEVVRNIRTYLAEDYEDEFLTVRDFDNIKELLISAASGIQVLAINSATEDELVYTKKTEKKYIAIGGNRLSRGFTLEGLTINYFIRNTDYADTLLQMGRWFGYRPGYLDCCKLFTTRENIHKFDTVTVTVEELEEVFKEINRKKGRPADFEIRVRNNPKVIKITRASILKNAEDVKLNYSSGIEQSTKFIINKQRIEKSWSGLSALIRSVIWSSRDDIDTYFYQTDAAGLFKFLDLENSFFDFDLQGVKEYVTLCNAQGKLTNWTIGIKRNRHAVTKVPLNKAVSGLPADVNLSIRRGPKEGSPSRDELLFREVFKVSGRSAQIVTSGADFALTLDPGQIARVKKNFLNRKIKEFTEAGMSPADAKSKAEEIQTIPDKDYRYEMDEKDGILMIYLIDLERVFESERNVLDKELRDKAAELDLNLKIPLFGYALGFPDVGAEIGGEYLRYREITEENEEEQEDEFIDALNEE